MRTGLLAIILAGCAASTPPPAPPAPVAHATPAAAAMPAGTASGDEAAPAGASTTDGDETVLMAKRWKYAAYFTAMKRKVAANWDPASVWKQLPAPMRTGLGTATRETMVEVTLAADGALVKLAILKASGVAELDAEAIRAFQISSPFGAWPGPPRGPFKFSFYFEVGGSSSLRVAP